MFYFILLVWGADFACPCSRACMHACMQPSRDTMVFQHNVDQIPGTWCMFFMLSLCVSSSLGRELYWTAGYHRRVIYTCFGREFG